MNDVRIPLWLEGMEGSKVKLRDLKMREYEMTVAALPKVAKGTIAYCLVEGNVVVDAIWGSKAVTAFDPWDRPLPT